MGVLFWVCVCVWCLCSLFVFFPQGVVCYNQINPNLLQVGTQPLFMVLLTCLGLCMGLGTNRWIPARLQHHSSSLQK